VPRQRFFVRIDHLTDNDLAFFGWVRVADDGEFGLFSRPRDGEQVVISNDPPRYIVIDDVNDAQAMSKGMFIIAPSPLHEN